MLKIINLHKDYHTKAETTHALKAINLEFGTTGFIVLLGKSGSGKSTLLNLIGGLDQCDEGEIVINDKSTKDFQTEDWDAYRNTYVGFVFQEFYMIEEFSVGKNIALALELREISKDETDAKVTRILKQVDLEGFADRKPNETSGGQKQRIAIARALIKNPQIILADEPTGNLDSDTGRMVLDTLKKLSQSRLVIMVTHDTDFAKEYADRIIELKDGLVISDVLNEAVIQNNEYITKNGAFKMIALPKGQKLSQELIAEINSQAINDDLYFSLSSDETYLNRYKTALTDGEAVTNKEMHGALLSLKNADKMARTSLKTKKLRLAITLFLFILSLIFVGFGSTLSFYSSQKAAYNTFVKTATTDYPLIKRVWTCEKFGNGQESCYWANSNVNASDISDFQTLFPQNLFVKSLAYQLNGFKNENQFKTQFYSDSFANVTIIANGQSLPLNIDGSIPKTDGEVLITDYMAASLTKFGILSDSEAVIGQTFETKNNVTLTITGVIETNYLDFSSLETADNEQDLMNSSFSSYQNAYYETIYMSQGTFDQINNSASLYTETYEINFVSPHYDYSGTLYGRLPQQDDEVVLTLKSAYMISGEENPATGDVPAIEALIGRQFTFTTNNYQLRQQHDTFTFKVVGIIDNDSRFNYLFTQNEFHLLSEAYSVYDFGESYISQVNLTGFVTQKRDLNSFLTYLSANNYNHATPFSSTLYGLDSFASEGRVVFYYIGAFFALFSALLIMTYIASSVANKKQDIGTLRAIGARGKDVAKIFALEGIYIALIASIIGDILASTAVYVINQVVTSKFHISVELLYINIFSNLFVIGLALCVVIIASLIPVRRISKMKPIYAIKNLKPKE